MNLAITLVVSIMLQAAAQLLLVSNNVKISFDLCKFMGNARDNPNRKKNETHETLLARARHCAPPHVPWTDMWIETFTDSVS